VEARGVSGFKRQDRPPIDDRREKQLISYAYAKIELPKPVDAVLLLGVDASEKIWVNESKVLGTSRPESS
jgi:hypothetical protein